MPRTIAIGDIHGRAIALAKLIEIIAPQPEVLDLGYLKCIDTGCRYGGWLTALDVDSGPVWQVNERGEVRS